MLFWIYKGCFKSSVVAILLTKSVSPTPLQINDQIQFINKQSWIVSKVECQREWSS